MTCLRPPIVVAPALVAAFVLLSGLVLAGQGAATDPDGATGRVTLSIVGTTDLHGRVFPNDGRGGLALLGGYLRNLRAARAADGGAVLLLDAGDAFEGGIASNISEGALVVGRYTTRSAHERSPSHHGSTRRSTTRAGRGGPPEAARDSARRLKGRPRGPGFRFHAGEPESTRRERRWSGRTSGRPRSSTPLAFGWASSGS